MDVMERLATALPTVRESAERTDSRAEYPSDSVAALARTGLLGVSLPAESGGAGGGPTEFVEAVTAVASACGSTAMVYLMHLAAAQVITAAPAHG